MTTRENVLLKLVVPGLTIIYIWSMLWVSVTYLYAVPYALIKQLGLGEVIGATVLVVSFSVVAIGFILFKIKGRSFWSLLMQDITLIIISGPFFSIILGYANAGFSDITNPGLRYAGMLLFTILTTNLNDWMKDGRPNANQGKQKPETSKEQ